MKCKWCGSENVVFRETPESVHYGRLDCKDCGRWIEWVKNPDSQRTKNPLRKVKLETKKVCDFHGFKTEHCFFCQRTKDELGWNETLEVDHIEELDKGGKDELQNMQVLCSACHKLKNWSRLYMNWHFKKGVKNE